MSALLLLPGYGGKYTSETFTAASTTGADTLDASHVAQLLVQIEHASGTPAGTIQIEQSVNGTDWASLGSPIDVATDGAVADFGITAGPYGLLRINATGISAGTLKVYIAGLPQASGF